MDLLKAVLLNTNPGVAAAFALVLGTLLVVSATGAVRETDERTALELFLIWFRRALVILLFTSLPLFALGLYALAYFNLGGEHAAEEYMGLWFRELKAAAADVWWSLIVVALTPTLLRLTINRWIRPEISAFFRRIRVRQSGDSLSDIRVEMERTKPKDFNPQSYYHPGHMFLGIDSNGKPLYMSDDVFRKNHLKIIGPSQTGKGVGLGVLIDQAIAKGWGAWFIDLKPDDFIYDIMRESCERNNRPAPTVQDLNGLGEGAYAPFANGTLRERRERVVKAFTLADSGSTADFYKRLERKVLDYLMPLWDGSLPHLRKLLNGNHPEINAQKREWILMNRGSLDSNLSEFMQLESMCATKEQSFNVDKALSNGEVVYIRSNMVDSVVRRGTIALLDEVVQVALKKPLPSPVFLVIDEVRFVVSDTLANALATVLSKGLNIAIAYQSVADLLNLPDKSLDSKAIKAGIEINTQTTLSYKANDDETAEWVAAQTGTVQKTVTRMERVEVNQEGAEIWGGERSVGQVEEQLITANQLLALPPRVGALIRPGALASLIYTCWVPLKERKGMPVRAPDKASPIDASPEPPEAAAPEAPKAPIQDEEDQTAYRNVPEASDSHNQSPARPAKKQQVKLTDTEQAAIDAALNGILSSDDPKPKPTPAGKAEPKPTRPDLSTLDDIEGI